MKKTIRPLTANKPKPVRCCECRHEIRDTEGPSYNMETGEFFLCRCEKGHHIDRYGHLAKLFREEDRICKDWARIMK